MLFLCLLNIKIALHTPLLEGEVATKHVGAALRIVAIVDTASHLGVVARVVRDSEEVGAVDVEPHLFQPGLLDQLRRERVAQLQCLEAEVGAVFYEAVAARYTTRCANALRAPATSAHSQPQCATSGWDIKTPSATTWPRRASTGRPWKTAKAPSRSCCHRRPGRTPGGRSP